MISKMLRMNGTALLASKYSVIAAALLTACSHLPASKKMPYNIDVPESLLVRFDGKGAAAGVMMSSSMGPMGIAIGVAIDEGIAKDIRSALADADCRLDDVAERSFHATSRAWGVVPVRVGESFRPDQIAMIRIENVAFRSQPDEQSLTRVELALQIERSGSSYPLHFPSPDEAGSGAPLEQIKADGSLACGMLRDALTHVFSSWYEQLQ